MYSFYFFLFDADYARLSLKTKTAMMKIAVFIDDFVVERYRLVFIPLQVINTSAFANSRINNRYLLILFFNIFQIGLGVFFKRGAVFYITCIL